MEEMLEGWYTDPYARHEARWMSKGAPTALVRDGNVEGHDPAPEEPFTVTPVRWVGGSGAPGGADLRRADDAGWNSESPTDRIWGVAGETMA